MKLRTRPVRAAVVTLIACLLLPVIAHANDPPSRRIAPPPVVFDAVVLRPLGLIATVIGTSMFVPAAILTAPMGSRGVADAWERFVTLPGRYTFTRKMGEY